MCSLYPPHPAVVRPQRAVRAHHIVVYFVARVAAAAADVTASARLQGTEVDRMAWMPLSRNAHGAMATWRPEAPSTAQEARAWHDGSRAVPGNATTHGTVVHNTALGTAFALSVLAGQAEVAGVGAGTDGDCADAGDPDTVGMSGE